MVMRGVFNFACLTTLALLTISPVLGQQKSAPVQTQPDDVWAQLTKLDWKRGPTQGGIASVATIAVPKGSAFLGSTGTRRFLELEGNVGSDNGYTFALEAVD